VAVALGKKDQRTAREVGGGARAWCIWWGYGELPRPWAAS